jgi:hypothetical protein
LSRWAPAPPIVDAAARGERAIDVLGRHSATIAVGQTVAVDPTAAVKQFGNVVRVYSPVAVAHQPDDVDDGRNVAASGRSIPVAEEEQD